MAIYINRKDTYGLKNGVKNKIDEKSNFFFLEKNFFSPGPHLNFWPNDLKSDALNHSATKSESFFGQILKCSDLVNPF